MFAFNLSGKPRSGTDLSYERCYFFSFLMVFHSGFHSGLLDNPTVSVQRFSFLYVLVIGSCQHCRGPYSLTFIPYPYGQAERCLILKVHTGFTVT